MAPRFCASQFGAPVQAILPSYFIRDANLVRQGHLPCVGRMVLLRQHRHEGGTDEVILYASFQTLAPAVPDVPKAASADAADLVLTILHVLQRGDEVHLSPVAVALGDAQGFHVQRLHVQGLHYLACVGFRVLARAGHNLRCCTSPWHLDLLLALSLFHFRKEDLHGALGQSAHTAFRWSLRKECRGRLDRPHPKSRFHWRQEHREAQQLH
mmetsp:Transcript_87641/g.203878  ORF Transcript_87641/g.203878 Transcript_87641/m.203878 type:complete len:211 (+) Transcript_87641:97-729(+)